MTDRTRAYPNKASFAGSSTAFTQTATTTLTTVPADLTGAETLAQTITRVNDLAHILNAVIDRLQTAGLAS